MSRIDTPLPSDHPPHPDGLFFTESDLVWHAGIDHGGVTSYSLLGVRGGRVDLPLSIFSAEERVDLYEDPIPKESGDDWWLLAAVRFTGIDDDSFGWPVELLDAARDMVAELCRERPVDLLAAGYHPDPLKLADMVVTSRWESIRPHLVRDPRLAWALSARDAAWRSAQPPSEASPRERFERLLLAELIGQELEEHAVPGLSHEAEVAVARAIADAAMQIWRDFRSEPANASELKLRRYGGLVALGPALLHLQFMEDARLWMNAPVPKGQSLTPLLDLIELNLRAAGLHEAAGNPEVIQGLRQRISNGMLNVDLVAHEPPAAGVYFSSFGIEAGRFTRLMERVVRLE